MVVFQEGITHPTDTALRDLSAKCLGEFVAWSIKQMSDAQLEHSPANIKAIMKQIYSFCLHPCPSKRLGEFHNLTVSVESDVLLIHFLKQYIAETSDFVNSH